MIKVMQHIPPAGDAKLVGEILPEGIVLRFMKAGQDAVPIGVVLLGGKVQSLEGNPNCVDKSPPEGIVMKARPSEGFIPVATVDAAGGVHRYKTEASDTPLLGRVDGTNNLLHIGADRIAAPRWGAPAHGNLSWCRTRSLTTSDQVKEDRFRTN